MSEMNVDEKKTPKRTLSQSGMISVSDSGSGEEGAEMLVAISQEYFADLVHAWCEKNGERVLKNSIQVPKKGSHIKK